MMWSYYNTGWNWLWMSGMMVVFWGTLLVFAVWAVRALSRPRDEAHDPMTTLRTRLAAGEITPDEFETTKRTLQG